MSVPPKAAADALFSGDAARDAALAVSRARREAHLERLAWARELAYQRARADRAEARVVELEQALTGREASPKVGG